MKLLHRLVTTFQKVAKQTYPEGNLTEDAVIEESDGDELANDSMLDTLGNSNPAGETQEEELSPQYVLKDTSLQPMRQSEELKAQGLNLKLAMDKAVALKKRKNLEGTGLNSKNSFAILDDSFLFNKAISMGIKDNTITMENIDILKDLELARYNLLTRNDELVNEPNEEAPSIVILPFEAKFIEWHSEDSDQGDFTEVISQRMKKKLAQLKKKRKNKSFQGNIPPSS